MTETTGAVTRDGVRRELPRPAADGSVVSSHGADFFGQDHHPARVLADIAEYLPGLMPAIEAEPVAQLLRAACTQPRVTDPETCAVYAARLRSAARHRFLRPALRRPAGLLADAAGRAAADEEPWTLGPA